MIKNFFSPQFQADSFTDERGRLWKKIPTEWLPVGADWQRLAIYISDDTTQEGIPGFCVRYYFSGQWNMTPVKQDHRGAYTDDYEYSVSDLLAAIVRRFPADKPLDQP